MVVLGLGGLSFSMGTPSWQLMMEAVVMASLEKNGNKNDQEKRNNTATVFL